MNAPKKPSVTPSLSALLFNACPERKLQTIQEQVNLLSLLPKSLKAGIRPISLGKANHATVLQPPPIAIAWIDNSAISII